MVHTSFAVTPVRTAELDSLLEQIEYSAPATVISRNSPDIASELMATVLSIPVHVGDRVNKGDKLLELDCRQQESLLASAKAVLSELRHRRQFAQLQLQRAVELNRKKSISQELLEQRKSELGSLDALSQAQQETIQQARLSVEDCVLIAPFNALVTKRHTSVGTQVSQGTPLLHLVQLDDVEISAQLRGTQAVSLLSASSIHYRFQGHDYGARIKHLLPLIDERLKTQEARLSFTGDTATIGSGGRLVWRSVHKQLPAQYLVRRSDQLGIMLEENQKTRFWPLNSAIEGQAVLIDFEYLPAQTRVIVEGQQGLEDGDVVQITQ